MKQAFGIYICFLFLLGVIQVAYSATLPTHTVVWFDNNAGLTCAQRHPQLESVATNSLHRAFIGLNSGAGRGEMTAASQFSSNTDRTHSHSGSSWVSWSASTYTIESCGCGCGQTQLKNQNYVTNNVGSTNSAASGYGWVNLQACRTTTATFEIASLAAFYIDPQSTTSTTCAQTGSNNVDFPEAQGRTMTSATSAGYLGRVIAGLLVGGTAVGSAVSSAGPNWDFPGHNHRVSDAGATRSVTAKRYGVGCLFSCTSGVVSGINSITVDTGSASMNVPFIKALPCYKIGTGSDTGNQLPVNSLMFFARNSGGCPANWAQVTTYNERFIVNVDGVNNGNTIGSVYPAGSGFIAAGRLHTHSSFSGETLRSAGNSCGNDYRKHGGLSSDQQGYSTTNFASVNTKATDSVGSQDWIPSISLIMCRRSSTNSPSKFPTLAPTNPTNSPSRKPTFSPSKQPSFSPTSSFPSKRPTRFPTTRSPSRRPSKNPSLNPTTTIPTMNPTQPTRKPSRNPTRLPSFSPSSSPTPAPVYVDVCFHNASGNNSDALQFGFYENFFPTAQACYTDCQDEFTLLTAQEGLSCALECPQWTPYSTLCKYCMAAFVKCQYQNCDGPCLTNKLRQTAPCRDCVKTQRNYLNVTCTETLAVCTGFSIVPGDNPNLVPTTPPTLLSKEASNFASIGGMVAGGIVGLAVALLAYRRYSIQKRARRMAKEWEGKLFVDGKDAGNVYIGAGALGMSAFGMEGDNPLFGYASVEGKLIRTRYSFHGVDFDELDVAAGVTLTAIERNEEWWLAKNDTTGNIGLIPDSYVSAV